MAFLNRWRSFQLSSLLSLSAITAGEASTSLSVTAFAPPQRCASTSTTRRQGLGVVRGMALGTLPDEEEVSKQLTRAKEILAKSQANLEAKRRGEGKNGKRDGKRRADESDGEPLPYYAAKKMDSSSSSTTMENKRSKVIKSVEPTSGLITTDGDLMAKLSEDEEWEARGLSDVFENELETMDDIDPDFKFDRSAASERLKDRDVAASISGLRLQMRTDDFEKVFDRKNLFIGDP